MTTFDLVLILCGCIGTLIILRLTRKKKQSQGDAKAIFELVQKVRDAEHRMARDAIARQSAVYDQMIRNLAKMESLKDGQVYRLGEAAKAGGLTVGEAMEVAERLKVAFNEIDSLGGIVEEVINKPDEDEPHGRKVRL